MIVSITAEKIFDKIQHSFRIKTPNMQKLEGSFVNFIKHIQKTTTNNRLSSEKLNSFTLKSGLINNILSYQTYGTTY